MTEAEARQLYVKMAASWPPDHRGVAAEVWIEILQELEAGTAGTAVIRLRDELDRPPTIHQFKQRYYALHTPTNDPIRMATLACADCGGSGWLSRRTPIQVVVGHKRDDDTGLVAAVLEERDPITSVRPCGCPAGRQAEHTATEIDKHRRANQLGPYRPKDTDTIARPEKLTDATLFGEHES